MSFGEAKFEKAKANTVYKINFKKEFNNTPIVIVGSHLYNFNQNLVARAETKILNVTKTYFEFAFTDIDLDYSPIICWMALR